MEGVVDTVTGIPNMGIRGPAGIKTGVEYEVLAFSRVTCELSHDFEEQNGKRILRFLKDRCIEITFIKIIYIITFL